MGQRVFICLALVDAATQYSRVVVLDYIPSSTVRVPAAPHSHQPLVFASPTLFFLFFFVHKNIHNSFIYSGQKLETSQMSNNRENWYMNYAIFI